MKKPYKKMRNKKCCHCQLEKPLNQFFNSSKTKDGKNWRCKECCKIKVYHHGKGIRKLCHGINCRGEKSFISYANKRYCVSCTSIKNNMEDGYPTGNITYHRKGSVG